MNETKATVDFNLDTFRARRDEAIASEKRWLTTADEVRLAYGQGERDFRGANLTRVCLTEATLAGTNLTEATLTGANLRGANLRWATLTGANLTGANLTEANLTEANLTAANLTAAILTRADLRWADLSRTGLTEAILTEAILTGAILTRADLRWADLTEAILTEAILTRADLIETKLTGAYLLDAHGLYSAFGLHLSSRQDCLYAGITRVGGKLELRFDAGCQRGLTAEELLALVKEEHGDNPHAQAYVISVQYIQALFALDLSAGKWDYLLKSTPKVLV